MKFLINIFFLLFVSNAIAQDNSIKTVTFTVSGACGDCKDRIENAADIKGVKKCTWNKETKVATLIFDEKKVTQDKVEQAIANAGYATEHVQASEKAYKKLPDCCQYNEPENKTH